MRLESLILIFIFTLVEENFDIQCPYILSERLILMIFITRTEENFDIQMPLDALRMTNFDNIHLHRLE